MKQNFDHKKSITFSLPDFLAQWPYERVLHPEFGTVDVDSATWVSGLHFFNEKSQRSFDASLFGKLILAIVVPSRVSTLTILRSPRMSRLSLE